MNGLPVKRTHLLAGLAITVLVLVGCSTSGGDAKADKATSTTTSEATTTEAAGPTTTTAGSSTTTGGGSSTGDVPTYEDAKRVYLAQADDITKAACADNEQDKDLNMPTGSYVKLICGRVVRFEYIEGADNDASEWPAISTEHGYRSVFHLPGQLIVAPVGSNDDFAPALADDCGCGEVVKQEG